MTCPSRQQLEEFLDEQVGDAERAAIEAHVGRCASCQQTLEVVAAAGDTGLLRSLHPAGHKPSEEPASEVLSRLERAGTFRPAEEPPSHPEGTSEYKSPAGSFPALPSAGAGAGDHPTREALAEEDIPDVSILAAVRPGAVLGQYKVVEQLGAGGMGHVYKAVHQAMDRTVALKVIAPHLLQDPRAKARFQQEVRTAARLHHPNIVLAYDAAEARGLWFLVMEYVEGTTLSQLLSRHGLPPVAMACEVIRQAAVGLQHAHEQGMVHRDIKPGNLMVTARQKIDDPAVARRLPGWPVAPLVKILDFGVARLRALGRPDQPAAPQHATLTQEGCVVGTPEFMSPEQACDSRTVDVRSDIYSLGCTLYFLLAGGPPFTADTALETMVKHLKLPPPPLDDRRPGLPPGLQAIVYRMLAKAPADRFQTPAELAAALRPWTGELPLPETTDGVVSARPSGPTPLVSPGAPRSGPGLFAAPQPPSTPLPVPPHLQQRTSGSSAGLMVLGVLLLALAVGIGWFVWSRYNPDGFLASRQPAATDDDQPKEPGRDAFVRIPAGEFKRLYGPSAGRQVRLLHPLEMAVTEVTRGEFRKFAPTHNGYRTLAERDKLRPGSWSPPWASGPRSETTFWYNTDASDSDDCPVSCVAWEDAVRYCNWLSQQEGRTPCYRLREAELNLWECDFKADGYRLPTDAEWEFAAQASRMPSGPELVQYGWFRDNADKQAHPAGKKLAGVHGLRDLWGNVWEWCWDWDGADPADADPRGPATGDKRVAWGGSWYDLPGAVAKAPRRALEPERRFTDLGFRVVRTAK